LELIKFVEYLDWIKWLYETKANDNVVRHKAGHFLGNVQGFYN